MDYTLIHYHPELWEGRAYVFLQQKLLSEKWPIKHLRFDATQACRGLIIDRLHGNLVKANRFGFIKQARHGTKLLDLESQRIIYGRTIIDLADSRWVFLNTLFSLSEGCIYTQLVDLLDQKLIPEPLSYSTLYDKIVSVLQEAHLEGAVKADIQADPERYIALDPEVPRTLLDQHRAGKKLVLITNSEWNYTQSMMSTCFDRFLGTSWQSLFDLIIVEARKPLFFTASEAMKPFFAITNSTIPTLVRPMRPGEPLEKGVAYLGGSAQGVERALGLTGDDILYIGDHMFGDVHVSKNALRWRTALILRELEGEIAAEQSFEQNQILLDALMRQKESLEHEICQERLALLQSHSTERLHALRAAIDTLDMQIGPLAEQASRLHNEHWGLLFRAGNDKSYLAYQMERYADVYTSRVSNFFHATPFAYIRSHRGSLPHTTHM